LGKQSKVKKEASILKGALRIKGRLASVSKQEDGRRGTGKKESPCFPGGLRGSLVLTRTLSRWRRSVKRPRARGVGEGEMKKSQANN